MMSKYTDTQKENQWDDRMKPTKKNLAKPFLPEKENTEASRPTKDDIRHAYSSHNGVNRTPGFASVAAAFDFEHHVGSDPALELQVLKSILVREGNLSQIEALVQLIMKPEAFPGDSPDYGGLCSSIIELLAKTRNQTVLIIEHIEKWREEQAAAVPFVWQNTNYLLKMCRDLDYLSQVTPLVELLGVPSESMRHNPLMLENPLDDVSVTPEDSGDDAAKLAEKTRLRQAEAVLQREERQDQETLAEKPSEDADNATATENKIYSHSHTQQDEFQDQQVYEEEAVSILNWYAQAQAQLQRLREPIAPPAIAKGTGRMEIPKPDKLEPINTNSMSHQRETILGESRRLTDFLSTSPIAETRKQPSKRNPKLKALNNPYSRAIEENSVAMRTRPASAVTSTQREESLEASAPVPQDEQPVEEVAEEYVVRPMTPSVHIPLSIVELEELRSIDQPSEAIAVVAASVLILLQPGNSVPTDVRWSAFKALDQATFQADLTDFDVGVVPKFKLRALRRFLSVDAFNPVALAESGSLAAAKLAVWVLRVIAAHPEGATYIKEVRTVLHSWDRAQQEAAEKRATISKPPPPKKAKKKKSQKKLMEPLDRLLNDVRRSGEAVNKAVMAELKNAMRGTLPAACGRVMEAVSILLEPKRKGSIDIVKGLMAKASARNEPTFEARIRDYGKPEAELVLPGPHGVKRVHLLQAYVEDSELENSALSYSSMSVSVLMSWVRSVVALVVFLYDEMRQQQEEDSRKNKAATKLQSLERKNQAKKAVERRREETQAAVKIQSRARVGLAKKSVERTQQATQEEEESAAAVKIQGVTRRKQAIQKVDQVRKSKQQEYEEDDVPPKEVVIEYDDQDVQRSAPKQIFAISNQEVESDKEDDYEDEGYSDEEEEEEFEAEDDTEKVVEKENTEELKNEELSTKNEEVAGDIDKEPQSYRNNLNGKDEENNRESDITELAPDQPHHHNDIDVDNEDTGEGREVLSPLRSPPQTASRNDLQTAESFGDTYGESDFEEFECE